jgi:hypothetical protein
VIDEWHGSDADDLYKVELDLAGPHWLVVEHANAAERPRAEVGCPAHRRHRDLTPTLYATPTNANADRHTDPQTVA